MADDGGFIVVEGHLHGDAGESVFAPGDRFDFVIHQLAVLAGDPVDGLEDRVDGPVADPRVGDLFALGVADRHRRAGDASGGIHQLQCHELPDLLHVDHLARHQGSKVVVVDLFFLVGKLFEAGEGFVELFVVEAKSQLFEPILKGRTARVLAHDQGIVQLQTDLFGGEDFVSALVFEHSVLMDAAFVGKGVFAHDRLVGLGFDAGDGGDEPAGGVDLLGVDAGLYVTEDVATDLECHDDLFQCGVARSLSQAVDGALDLTRAVLDRRQGVGDGET